MSDQNQPGMLMPGTTPQRQMITADDVNPISMMFDPVIAERVLAIAQTLAKGTVTVPKHLQNNVGDCLAIVMQAASWRLNPFAVAQKTFLVGGKLGYEAQLMNAIATSLRVIEGRFSYRYFGDWAKIAKKPGVKKSNSGYEVAVSGWNEKDEEGLGVIISAKIRGDSEPRDHELLLVQAWPRNSTLWATNPKQQIAYLAVKQWMRLYAPDAILGIYTVDELEEQVVQGSLVEETTGAAASIMDKARERRAQQAAPVAQDSPAQQPAHQEQQSASAPEDERAEDDGEWPQDFRGTLYDSRGLPWTAAIHSVNRTCNDDGTWRKKRGVGQTEVNDTEKNLRRLNWSAVHTSVNGKETPPEEKPAEQHAPDEEPKSDLEHQQEMNDGGPVTMSGSNEPPMFTADQIHDGIVSATDSDGVQEWLDVMKDTILDGDIKERLEDLAYKAMDAFDQVSAKTAE